ncbi:MAG: lipoyl(octanoyl) transferase [Deltaproteobacteria bacterium]|nr:lipoyl(octanoyl) transferase [Deltaproteobacteria bacterium]
MALALETRWLGTVAYDDALARQLAAVEARRAGGPDRLLLLEHPPVVTLGRSAKPENLLTPRAELAARGVAVHEIARGGDVTWHGPGQLVGYVIADLAARGAQDVSLWLRGIEACLIEALAELGVPAKRVEGMTGVFVDDSIPPRSAQAAASATESRAQRGAAERRERGQRKIASIGVGLKGWITYHGFALNVTPDLAGFGDIVPCGLSGVTMTSVARELALTSEFGSAAERSLFASARERVGAAFERALA